MIVQTSNPDEHSAHSEVVGDDGGEDACHGVIVEGRDVDNVEMTNEARCDWVTTTTRRTHSAQELNVNQLQTTTILLLKPEKRKKREQTVDQQRRGSKY